MDYKIFLLLFLLICSLELHSNDIDSVTVSKTPVMLEFGSVGCYSCDKMAKINKKLMEQYNDRIEIRFIDIREGENVYIKEEYFIEEIPAQVFLDQEGKVYFRHTGFFSEKEIIDVFNQKLPENQKIITE